MFFRPFLSFCRAGCLLLSCAVAGVHAAPQVVASIRPLQLLAAELTDGVSMPQVVMAPGQDPHHFALRPSDRRALDQADLVLWIGPALEVPLQKAVIAGGKPVITAQSVPDILLLAPDKAVDPHLWLDSRNARRIAAALLTELTRLDAGNAAAYRANAARFTAQLDQLDAELAGTLRPWQRQPWAVSHQAFRYLANQYGLQEPLALTDSNNASPGVQSVLQLREHISRRGVRCVLTEPSENHQQLDAMLDNKLATIVAADVLGTALEPQAGAFVALLRQVGTTLQRCLEGKHE